MSLVRYKEHVLRLFGRKKATFRTVSDREWVHRPATVSIVPPAIFAESDLSRITGTMPDTSVGFELRRIRGGPREHRATLAFELSGVTLRDGFLRKGPWSHRLLKAPRRSSRSNHAVSIAEASIGCTLFGNVYFAHWITDDLTLHLAAQDFAPPIAAQRKLYHHESGYRTLFDVEPLMAAHAHIQRFTMLDDFGQNAYKAERYRVLRDRLRSACVSSGTSPGANPRIYLRRGTRGVPRTLVNTAEVESYLVSQGFLILDPETQSPAEIARLANGAAIAISVEGSHMIHGFINLAENGVLCQIQPPYRFNNLFKDYTDCLGMHYAFTVGLPAEDGFTLPLDDLKHFLHRVESLLK